jgi:4-amino-4-deoxy-L-arabinose transferase-like glycosyltransferase
MLSALKIIAESEQTRAIVGLLFFAAAINLPFVGQAFHMDDGFYLILAKNIRSDFWFPQDRPIYFEGVHVADLASTEHPWPFTSYLIAVLARMGGGYSESALHLGFLVFPIVLAISMYHLARRFTGSPVCATLVFLILPVIYVLSHTLMTDVPLLSFWVASVSLFCHGVDKGKKGQLFLGAFAAALASLVSYSGLCLIPLLSLYAILRKDRGALAAVLIVPAAVLGIFLSLNSHHYHRFTPAMLLGYYFLAKRVLSPTLLLQKLLFAVLAVGTLTVFPVTLLTHCRRKLVFLAFVFGVAAVLLTEVSRYSLAQQLLFLLFFCAGVPLIIDIAGAAIPRLRNRARPDDFFLSNWFIGVLIFNVLVYMNGSARYLLPATPAIVLICFRRIERASGEMKLQRVAKANLLLAGSLSVLLAIADYQFAGIYRGFALKIAQTFPGRELWFTGEWGFRTYLEQAGGRQLGQRDSSPRPGDILVVPTLATPYQTLFSEALGLQSIVMVAPSRIKFDLPPISKSSVLVLTTGMPFHEKSDGMEFSVRFLASDTETILKQERISPSEGNQWLVHEIPLSELAGMQGSLLLSAETGSSADATADWLAIARARVCNKDAHGETPVYDLKANLKSAQIESAPNVQYHTDGNVPVLVMTVWLKQEAASILRGRYEYRPSIPLRLLDGACHAGFWSSGWGLLPFSVAEKGSVLESFSVYEISRSIDAYGESIPAWYEPEAGDRDAARVHRGSR